MTKDINSHSVLATPPARPRHALKPTLTVVLELAESGPDFGFEPKQVNAGTRGFFGVVSALAARLDLALTPFLGEQCRSGFE